MAFFSLDTDGRIEWVLQKTLLLWLLPYIFWYFGREVYTFVYAWVTEPDSGGTTKTA